MAMWARCRVSPDNLTWGVVCSSHTATAAAGIQGEHQKYPHCSYQHHALSNLPFPLTPYWQDPPHDHDLIFVSPLLLTAPIISLLVIQANVQRPGIHTLGLITMLWFDDFISLWGCPKCTMDRWTYWINAALSIGNAPKLKVLPPGVSCLNAMSPRPINVRKWVLMIGASIW